ncbi:hypothetical protein Pyn_19937 [Prunus yedoensis var. nudiflora]|uniref:Uncharacterized protein n=1 Tax=Prunus yedoensis var. nudiflora TaxID=2094558 RepID=A0A314XTQ3_PRUYE|nr:hypothetical protein Pyn_19937 [Prunus yedoensis var. nudiflora]
MLGIDILEVNLGHDQMTKIHCIITREVIEKAQYFNNNKSRLLMEFEEIKVLGEGAFEVVVSSKNRIDKKTHEVKKVRLVDFLISIIIRL